MEILVNSVMENASFSLLILQSLSFQDDFDDGFGLHGNNNSLYPYLCLLSCYIYRQTIFCVWTTSAVDLTQRVHYFMEKESFIPVSKNLSYQCI